jgi:4-alpha-glucanotransferase
MVDDDHFLTAAHWNRIGVRHHHGICLPIGALTTQSSCGIGEYLDLLPLIRWLPNTGFDLIQILPINDTGDDPSPYMGISANALHPIYLSLRALPDAESIPELSKSFDLLYQLNHSPAVCYHDVLNAKLHALSIYLKHKLSDIEHDPDFQSFLEANCSWLTPYSIFRALKGIHHGKAWWDWNIADIPRTEASLQSDATLSRHILRWRAIQYLCFLQWRQVRKAADSCGVLLTGDVPILINKDSADVWWHPELFSLKRDVGAPPDMYNKDGQHWGFPLFHWANHRKNHFAWWKERLRVQETLYHLYRLDHLVGFFRLYAISPNKKGNDGTFVPKTPQEWKALGEEILTMMVQATSMLPLGEDLGDVPDLVRQSMHALGVPGLKVLRWERKWHSDQSFISPTTFSPESVTTVSTHDSSTLQGWWEEDPKISQQCASEYGLEWEPKLSPSLLFNILNISHHSGSLFHINLLNEYLSLFPELSWGDPEKERINRPGTLSPNNWTYRIKVSLDTMIAHPGLIESMRSLSCSLKPKLPPIF